MCGLASWFTIFMLFMASTSYRRTFFFSLTNLLKKVVRRVIKKGFYRQGSGMIESLSMRGPQRQMNHVVHRMGREILMEMIVRRGREPVRAPGSTLQMPCDSRESDNAIWHAGLGTCCRPGPRRGGAIKLCFFHPVKVHVSVVVEGLQTFVKLFRVFIKQTNALWAMSSHGYPKLWNHLSDLILRIVYAPPDSFSGVEFIYIGFAENTSLFALV